MGIILKLKMKTLILSAIGVHLSLAE